MKQNTVITLGLLFLGYKLFFSNSNTENNETMAGNKKLYAILVYGDQGNELGYWTNSTDDITNGNPDLWTKKEAQSEIIRAKRVAEKKRWKVTFHTYEY